MGWSVAGSHESVFLAILLTLLRMRNIVVTDLYHDYMLLTTVVVTRNGHAHSVTAKKCHQKKPSLLSNGATEPRTDNVAEFSYHCSLYKYILKYVVHSEQKLCTFE